VAREFRGRVISSDTLLPRTGTHPGTSLGHESVNGREKPCILMPYNESDRLIWVDGVLCPWATATVHVLSHSVQRGSLVFDYMGLHELPGDNSAGLPAGPAVFRLAEHVERFFDSCRLMGLDVAYDAADLRSAVCETVRANPGARAVKLSAYFASVEVDVVPIDARVTVAIAAYDPQTDIQDRLPSPPPPRRPHLALWIEKERANRREDIVSPQAKVAANYASPMIAKARARAEGFDEIVLVDEDGHLAEGPTTNLFLVDAEGTLCTPPAAKVLHGVTRRSVLELARADGVPVREAALRPDALLEASEAFLTGTTAGVWPVSSVDRRPLEPCPGPLSSRLRERFRRVVRGGAPEFAGWLTPVGG